MASPSKRLPAARMVKASLVDVRGKKVVLSSDLATFYGTETKRLNEAVKRNQKKFAGFAFKLREKEWKNLRSQFATSNQARGGSRYLPWAFTEHGIVMAATVLNTDTAIKASRLIVDVFIAQRHHAAQGGISGPAGLANKIQRIIDHLLDALIDTELQATAREEAQQVFSDALKATKDYLQKQGHQNKVLAAKASQYLAEAELTKARAAKTRAETKRLELETLIIKLRLVLEAQRLVSGDDNVHKLPNLLAELAPEAELRIARKRSPVQSSRSAK